MAASIVGTWDTFVDWSDNGQAIVANQFTINADGTWTYKFGGGRWQQQEGLCYFNFTNAPGLVYTANVTRDTLSGIMGYLNPGESAGAWWGTRTGAPHALAAEGVIADVEKDLLVGPPDDQS
jgi:hypothetical protein